MDVILDRCAGLDVHKRTVGARVFARRVRAAIAAAFGGAHVRDVRVATRRPARDWLVAWGVTEVAMEATGVFWKPVWHVLDDRGLDESCWSTRAHQEGPGPQDRRQRRDVARPAVRVRAPMPGSFIPPVPIRRLRDLTRYRKRLIPRHAREVQRVPEGVRRRRRQTRLGRVQHAREVRPGDHATP